MQPRRLLATAGSLLSAFVVGGLVAVQSHINGRLAVELGAGVTGAAVAASISFGSGLLLLCLLCASVPRSRAGLRRIAGAVRAGRLRPWHLVGGSAGALLVAAQGLTVATIGVALFTVAVVAGQTSSAMVVDKVGVGPAGHRPVTLGRAVGAALAVIAVGLAVSERLDGAAALAPGALLLAALPMLAGGGAAWQQAVNGQVSVVGGPFPAAAVNFLVGTAVLALFVLVALAAAGSPAAPPPTWWLYLGGACGVVFISSAAVLVRLLGVLVFGLCAISGQVITALLVDLLVADVAIGALTVAGALLTLLGVAIAAVRVRRRTPVTAAHARDQRRSPTYSE
ncbi:MAG TPA: DMT family transporter [Nocardioidaceae bacterium]|nr:DMT family transporter [Nocardioidaceae bacterium]